MFNDKFTNREIDKKSVQKSKDYLWKYIKNKIQGEKAPVSSKVKEFFKNLFLTPKRLIPVSAVAVLVVVAIIFNSTLQNWFTGEFLQAPTVYADFEMTADSEDTSGVDGNSTFTLKASEDLDETAVAENLKVSPEVELEVKKINEGEYKIDPVQNLEGNKVYNFSIISTLKNTETGAIGTEEYSWAYQIKDVFKIAGSLPADKAVSVPTDTGIEIYFSHENFDFKNVNNYFEISPKTEGTFEHHQRALSFVPKDGLKTETIYTVTLKKGLPLNDSDQILAEDFVFMFETNQLNPDYSYNYLNFTRDYYEIPTKQDVALEVWGESENQSVEVYKYKNLEQYEKTLKDMLSVPSWCLFAKRAYKHDISDLEFLGTYKTVRNALRYENFIYLPDSNFEPGYYLFQLIQDSYTAQALVQVTDLANYINITLTDTLVWVNDLATGNSAAGTTVEISGASYKTDADGIATFKTPDEWKVDYSESESSYIKITSQDGKTLITPIFPYASNDLGAKFWKTFTTDRSMYKPTDTIKFWGFVKPKISSVNNNDLKIKILKSWDTFVKEIPVTLQNNNIFKGEIDIKKYSPDYYYLILQQGDEEITRISFNVADYVKPAYNFTVEADKKAVFAGEKYAFNVKSTFFEGTSFPYLQFDYYDIDSGQNITGKTDINGKAAISYEAKKNYCTDRYCYDIRDHYFDVEARFAEETSIWSSADVRIFDSRINISAEQNVEDSTAKIDVTTNWIDLSKLNNASEALFYDYIGKTASNRKVSGKITEITWNKIEEGQYYDFINKKTQKNYRYEEVRKPLPPFEIITNSEGKASYSFKIEQEKYYEVALNSDDDQGNTAHDNVFVYGSSSRTQNYDNYSIMILNGEKEKLYYSFDWPGYSPASYFDINEKVKAAFVNGSVPLKESEKGKFLFQKLANGLQEYSVSKSPDYSFDFSKDDVPNVYVDGVWFNGEKYEDANESAVFYKKDLKNLNISLKPDKEKYKPGDYVTLEFKVEDIDGHPSAAAVNINLVDEAFFKIAYGSLANPLNFIYSAISTGVLNTYDSHDNPIAKAMTGGAEGGGCFTGDTKILMADYTYKAIKNIKKGNIILTKKHEFSSELVSAKVTNTVSHFISDYLVVNENLEITPVHTVFVNGKWDIAGNLKVGDIMLGKNDEEIKISSIRQVKKPVWVYNFEVEKYHTFFANDYYVHNDKGGGWTPRDDFSDTAFYEVVNVDASGLSSVKFKLPDNITSWRVMASAIDTENLRGGKNTININAGLPFFTDLIVNKEYSIKDSPIIKFRSFGDNLKENQKVDYWVSAESLGLKESEKIEGKAFEGSYYKLPELKLGKHEITLYADGIDARLKDSLVKPINVVGSRLKKDILKFEKNVDQTTIFNLAKNGPTEITLMDGGIAFYYYDLLNLYYTGGDRFDQKLSKIISGELFQKYFGEKWDADDTYLVKNYQNADGGLTLLPYSSSDLRLSALALYVDLKTGRYNDMKLKEYFYNIYKNPKSNLEEIVLSLLGLASMDEPVLLSLREIQNVPELNLAEKIYIALAFESLGAKNDAMAIYKNIFKELAEKNVYETALGAMLAAGLQEENSAALLWEYVEMNSLTDDIKNLYALGYVKNSLAHASSKPAELKVKVGSHTEKTELGLWKTYSLMAFPDDVVAVSVDSGDVAAVIHYSEEVDPASFQKDNRVSIKRIYHVNGEESNTFKDGDLVEIRFSIESDKSIEKPFFKVTDILPSGLAPVIAVRGFDSYSYTNYPYDINGQEIVFYWSEWSKGNTNLKYYARVVNAGKFYADPAKIENYYDPTIANISASSSVEIFTLTEK